MKHVFVGYDSREDEAFRVCQFSILQRSKWTKVHKMEHRELRHMGLFDRPWRIGESGQYTDERDGKPFSTEFSHSRFLIAELARAKGIDGQWVAFCDCDFLFLEDIGNLFALADDRYAVMCVKHRHEPPQTIKMDRMAQTRYFRKNWSSLFLLNLAHPANRDLTADRVNHETGQWLHAFQWLDDAQIGGLPEAWNWLAGHSPSAIAPKAVHYTEGGPWFPEYHDVPYAVEWLREREAMSNPRPSTWERLSA